MAKIPLTPAEFEKLTLTYTCQGKTVSVDVFNVEMDNHTCCQQEICYCSSPEVEANIPRCQVCGNQHSFDIKYYAEPRKPESFYRRGK